MCVVRIKFISKARYKTKGQFDHTLSNDSFTDQMLVNKPFPQDGAS